MIYNGRMDDEGVGRETIIRRRKEDTSWLDGGTVNFRIENKLKYEMNK